MLQFSLDLSLGTLTLEEDKSARVGVTVFPSV